MRLVKPSWILHQDDKTRPGTIFSLAIHPDGSRLATGALDTKIKIWSTLPIVDADAEDDEDIPKLLCTMTSHSGEYFGDALLRHFQRAQDLAMHN